MTIITGLITAFLWPLILQFWGWLAGGAIALLAFLFSPKLRKYSLAVIAVFLLLAMVFIWGYNSNHNVETITHSCDSFKSLLNGPEAQVNKIITVFHRKGLCQ